MFVVVAFVVPTEIALFGLVSPNVGASCFIFQRSVDALDGNDRFSASSELLLFS